MQLLRDPAARKILVVDDDESIVDLLSTRLAIAGYRVFTATDGFEAIRALKDQRPHAMILDINMPGLDGFGVLEHMKKQGAHRPPTLVLTARHNAQDVEKAIRLGAKDYLAKPFDDRMLLARVARLLRSPTPARVALPPGDLMDV
jgi:two-component system OmpR family response regulator